MSVCLVTGAAGFIGSSLINTIVKNGDKVIGVDNFRTGYSSNLLQDSDNFIFVEADVSDKIVVDSLFSKYKPEITYHLAALVSVKESSENPELNWKLNYEMTTIIADVCCKYNCKIVFSSTAAVYETNNQPCSETSKVFPVSPYGVAKLESEKFILNNSNNFIIARFFNVYGIRQNPSSPYAGVISKFGYNTLNKIPRIIYGDGNQVRDFINVLDVVDILHKLAKLKQCDVFNVCTGNPTSLLKLDSIFNGLAPNNPRTIFLPAMESEVKYSVGSNLKTTNAIGDVSFQSIEPSIKLLFFEKSS